MAHKFKLEIETGNAAFDDEDRPDYARTEDLPSILLDVVFRLNDGWLSGDIHNSNGNRVGEFLMIHESD
jgi:hypothetical protein